MCGRWREASKKKSFKNLEAASTRAASRTVSNRSSPAPLRSGDRLGNTGERKDQPERIVQQRQSAEAPVPAGRLRVRRIDGERHAADLGCHRQGASAGRQQQVATKTLAL